MNNKEIISQWRDKADSIYVHTLQRTYFRLFGHQIDQRFAIVGNARTGSNYLLDGLKTSPSVRMYHEIFADHNRRVGEDFDKILSTIFQYESDATKIVGFKVFYNHLTDEEWKKLAACPGLKVIHLLRHNRLRTVISLEIAFKTGQWTKSGNASGPKEKRVTLSPSKLIKRLEQIEEGECAARARFTDREILEIVYEELVRSPVEVFEAVGAYLGVEGIDPGKIRLKRQNPETLRQLIVNYAEVEAVLRNTRFEEYLND
ncbi:MAG TPA: Stf0 family sulfotransferase [Anaerolineales bacterium]|nr:Stf0 family sulfotransferase [Anaerolineales bacterium]HLO28648.1 Stf0 family sulfotransferase [Anaerolineales bacterium]